MRLAEMTFSTLSRSAITISESLPVRRQGVVASADGRFGLSRANGGSLAEHHLA